LEIVLSKEKLTIRNISITNEIRIPLTHQYMDLFKETFLVLVPGLEHQLSNFY
jgi:hypothetical protein